eukprot:5995775-Amphidinium_carterae.1
MTVREQAGTPLPLQEEVLWCSHPAILGTVEPSLALEVAQRVQAVLSCTPAGPSQANLCRAHDALWCMNIMLVLTRGVSLLPVTRRKRSEY